MQTGIPREENNPDSLFARARGGDNEAWVELFRVCYPKVIRVVRRKLNGPMRSLYDSTDFASDVMKSLAANAGRLDFPSMNSLLAFLAQVAEQKVIDEHRKAHTLKRDINRLRSLDANGRRGSDMGDRLASADPTPSQIAQATEAYDILLEGKSDEERAAILLKEQGYSLAEIGERLGWHLRKVQRFFKNLGDDFEAPGSAVDA